MFLKVVGTLMSMTILWLCARRNFCSKKMYKRKGLIWAPWKIDDRSNCYFYLNFGTKKSSHKQFFFFKEVCSWPSPFCLKKKTNNKKVAYLNNLKVFLANELWVRKTAASSKLKLPKRRQVRHRASSPLWNKKTIQNQTTQPTFTHGSHTKSNQSSSIQPIF